MKEKRKHFTFTKNEAFVLSEMTASHANLLLNKTTDRNKLYTSEFIQLYIKLKPILNVSIEKQIEKLKEES